MARNGPRRGPSRARTSTPDDLVAVAFDDAVLDRLAARSRRSEDGRCPRWTADASTDWISDQFAKWQDRLVRPAAPAVLDADRAAALVASAPRRSSLRPALAVVAAIFALLVGSAVVGARSARPGDPLFPVTQVFWSDQADSAVAGEEVRGVIDAARDAIRVGRTDHAAVLLTRASAGLSRISDQADHAAVQRELDAAWDLLAAVTAHATPQPSWADAVGGATAAGLPVQAGGPPVITTPPAAPPSQQSPAAAAPVANSTADDTAADASSGQPSASPAEPSAAADVAPAPPSSTDAATHSTVPAAPPPPAAGTSTEAAVAPTTRHDDGQAASTVTTPAPPTSVAEKPSPPTSAPASSTQPSSSAPTTSARATTSTPTTSAPATSSAPTTSASSASTPTTSTASTTVVGVPASPAGVQDDVEARTLDEGPALPGGPGAGLVAPTSSTGTIADSSTSQAPAPQTADASSSSGADAG